MNRSEEKPMLRSFFIYLSKAAWARNMITGWEVSRRAASRFVSGETLDDAIRAVQVLNDKGINATLDHLGEHTTNPEEASRATDDIIEIFETIDKAGVRSNVSIKLSQIGMALDVELCARNLERILQVSKQHRTFLRIDGGPALGGRDAGCLPGENEVAAERRSVIQSLSAVAVDAEQPCESRPGAVCKGAYKEPAEIAFRRKRT
jgi:proline dehydrogenase